MDSTVLMPITINEYMICTYMLIYELHENDGKNIQNKKHRDNAIVLQKCGKHESLCEMLNAFWNHKNKI